MTDALCVHNQGRGSFVGSREITRGPTAAQVSRNVADLRRARGLSLGQLSEVMSDLGRPILASGLGKIETGERRVDVDDLVALALALGVSPVRLLLPIEAHAMTEAPEGDRVDLLHGRSSSSVEIGPGQFMPWQRAWEWMCGDEPPMGIDTYGDWQQENRPHVQQRPTGAALRRLANTARDGALALERAAILLHRDAEAEDEVSPEPVFGSPAAPARRPQEAPRG
ncbi:helix-turn-helix domain-containing protein [Geodermatophilus sp. SYSU D00742]